MKKLLKNTLDEIFIYSISVLCIIGNIFIKRSVKPTGLFCNLIICCIFAV